MLGHKFVWDDVVDVPCNIYFLYVHGAVIISQLLWYHNNTSFLYFAITAPAGGEILVTCIN